MYRVAIVGGRRGLHHAEAYRTLAGRASIVAIAELDDERRATASAALGVPGYADWQAMLAAEQPDVLHAVTTPLVPRALWVAPAAAAGVKLLVIEKPLALTPAEGHALASAIATTGLKVVVNHQRRYMPFAEILTELLTDPIAGLGPVHWVRGSTIGKVMDMVPHLLDLGHFALGDCDLERVWATANGFENHPEYPGPERLLAEYAAANGARLVIEATPEHEPTMGRQDFPVDYPEDMPGYGPHRCNLDLWAERGRFWWREWGSWGYEIVGRSPFHAPTAFKRDDPPAQAAFTRALYDWLDGGPPHRNRFENAYRTFQALIGAVGAAQVGQALALPAGGLMVPPLLTDSAWQKALTWLKQRPVSQSPAH